MAKIDLKKMNMGLDQVPAIDPLHDTQTLLNRSLGTDSDDYRSIPLDRIRINPGNDYSDTDTEEDMIELAQDIERNGLLHNIVVSDRTTEDGTFLILSGERRYRAYRYLSEHRRDNKYNVILCKVLTGLDALDEMLVLDAANLQTRGSMGDERRFRKATMRFIENLQKKGGLSEESAKTLALRYTSMNEKLLDKNLLVEKQLHPEILSLLDRDLIPKNQAVAYARLPEDIQGILAENLQAAYAQGSAELRDVNDKLAIATKTIAELTAKVEVQEKGMREIDEEISDAQLSLDALNAMAEAGESSEELETQMNVVRKTLSELEMQKRMYTSTITSARAALKKSADKLSLVGAEKKTGNALRDDAAAMVNKAMKKAETGVSGVTSKTGVGRMLKMEKSGRMVMLERMQARREALDVAIRTVESAEDRA